MMKFFKIKLLIISFICLTGFVPIVTLIGPASTMISSGSIFKAGFQFIIDQSIQKKTGTSSFMFVKKKIEEKNDNKQFNEKFKKLVEERIKIARQKIELQNINQ